MELKEDKEKELQQQNELVLLNRKISKLQDKISELQDEIDVEKVNSEKLNELYVKGIIDDKGNLLE